VDNNKAAGRRLRVDGNKRTEEELR